MSDRRRFDRRIPLLLLLGFGLALAWGLVSAPRPAGATSGTPLDLWAGSSPTVHPVSGHEEPWSLYASSVLTSYVYLPLIARAETCQPILGESYATLSVNPPPTVRPAEAHADLNLALRGYELTDAFKGLVVYNGGGDPNAPQLPGLFADGRTGVFSNVYQVYDWDWGCNCRGELLANWPVTLAGLQTTPGETLHVPNSGYSVGGGYEVLVLYASTERITLKYTRDDNVVSGYTLHVENVCVEPNLLALYETSNAAGRAKLPALRPGQAFGRARGEETGVTVRDNGSFMDPRSRDDWWRGR